MTRSFSLRRLLGAGGLFLLFSFTSIWAGSVSAAPVTKVFQLGRDGFTGVRDTWVARLDWDTPPQHTVNYGQNTFLRLSRDGGENPLLWFDVSAIPANSTVISAVLELRSITVANPSGGAPKQRKVQVFRVLKAWDEGNQISSPVDAAGKRGATGDFAFRYFPGEGTDVPWTARGMGAGTDYDSQIFATTDVLDPAAYYWDLASLVRLWVRAEAPNAGLVLRDATGYEEDNLDWRDFVSSQGSDAEARPKLTVTYDPDTPTAHAGADQVNLSWQRTAITLDGSASHDRPGGNDAALTYSWKAISAAYGSNLVNSIVGTSRVSTFTPDAAGDWEIELTVRNNVGSTATDRVRLRLLEMPASHPRIFLTPSKLATLRSRANESNPRWAALQEEAADPEGEMHAKALVSRVTGAAGPCDHAVTRAMALAAEASMWSSKVGDIALVYDWCHDRLSADQKATLVSYFNRWGDDRSGHASDDPGWGNYWPRWAYSYALAGLATWGDNPRAQEWMDEFRYRRFQSTDLPLLERIADGGAWPEGMIYDWIANPPRVEALEAWRTATGENLFPSTKWFENRLPHILLRRFPGTADQWGYQFHPYASIGDSERNRGSISNYERIMGLMLIERFPSSPFAPQLQAYFSAPPTAGSMDFLAHKEFLWYNPDQPQTPPTLLTHFSRGTGTLVARSGWPSGAADTDPSATFLTFQCGDHFTYHQHYDQNSFTLFRGADLLLDAGVYSGDGLSYHDTNYYVRTVAHNTLTVFNPSEDFSNARPDAESNDGGQRSMYPASRYPTSIEYFDQYARQYETGDVLRFSDTATHTYALGDATRAYNSPVYSQSMDTTLTGNTPKVSRFQREFAYLRPIQPGGDDYVVLLDRVGVTQAAFSGANTKLLFHVLDEPTVNGTPSTVSPGETLYSGGDMAVANRGTARVFIKTLLPQNRNFRKVGGRGVKAFWVNGANYDWHWAATEAQPRPTNDFEEEPYGEWRLELEPGDQDLEHTFLTVIQPASVARVSMAPVQLISSDSVAGVHIADSSKNRVVLFSSAVDGATISTTVSYTFVPGTATRHMVANLEPGAKYQLTVVNTATAQNITLSPSAAGTLKADSGGVVTFETEKGSSASPGALTIGTGSSQAGTRVCVPIGLQYTGAPGLVAFSAGLTYDSAVLTPASVTTPLSGKTATGTVSQPGTYRIDVSGGSGVFPAGTVATVCFDTASGKCGTSPLGFAIGSLSGSDASGAGVPLSGDGGSAVTTGCTASDVLSLSQDRVAVTLNWRNQYSGVTGKGTPVKQLDQYGYFWFDSAQNPEVFVKVLDFGGDSFLVFHSALSDLEYTVTFRVLRTGLSYSFKRDAGSVCGLADGTTVKK